MSQKTFWLVTTGKALVQLITLTMFQLAAPNSQTSDSSCGVTGSWKAVKNDVQVNTGFSCVDLFLVKEFQITKMIISC